MRIHLLRAPWLAVARLLTSWPLDRIQAVDRLMAQAKVVDPPWAFSWKSELSRRQADDAEKKRDRENFQEWTNAWSTKIVTDPDAPGERLVLF